MLQVIYCRECVPRKVIAAGVDGITSHVDIVDPFQHTDIAGIKVDEDFDALLLEHGSASAVLEYLTETYAASLT